MKKTRYPVAKEKCSTQKETDNEEGLSEAEDSAYEQRAFTNTSLTGKRNNLSGIRKYITLSIPPKENLAKTYSLKTDKREQGDTKKLNII